MIWYAVIVGRASRSRSAQEHVGSGGLVFPGLAGCAGTRYGHPGAAERAYPCMEEPVGTVKHRFEYPRPHTVRLFVCEAHAVGHPDPRPLTGDDRAELRRRRQRVRNLAGTRLSR